MRRGCLWSTAVALLLPVGLAALYLGWCVFENVTGPLDCAEVLKKIAARGEPTRYEDLIPRRIPDAENLAATELFQGGYDPGKTPHSRLDAALQNLFGSENPRFGSYLRGELVDRKKLADFLARRYREVFSQRTIPSTPLAQVDELCPALADLRKAVSTRTECQFSRDYETLPPWDRPLGGVTSLIKLAKAINLHALAALQSGAPDIALQDVHLLLVIDDGVRREPILISGLVAIGMFAIMEQTVWEGIENHAWDDAQLFELQDELASIDFLSDGQLCLRGEALGFAGPMLDFIEDHQKTTREVMMGLIAGNQTTSPQLRLLFSLTPHGAYEAAKAKIFAADFAAADVLDPVSHRVHPNVYTDADSRFAGYSRYTPPMILAQTSTGPVVSAVTKFALAQFRADTASMACKIERYRLEHGDLPSSQRYLFSYGTVPADLCNGKAYTYTPRPDGTFLLYSVGWNMTDDGGTVFDRRDATSPTADETKGDWVWPQPGRPGT